MLSPRARMHGNARHLTLRFLPPRRLVVPMLRCGVQVELQRSPNNQPCSLRCHNDRIFPMGVRRVERRGHVGHPIGVKRARALRKARLTRADGVFRLTIFVIVFLIAKLLGNLPGLNFQGEAGIVIALLLVVEGTMFVLGTVNLFRGIWGLSRLKADMRREFRRAGRMAKGSPDLRSPARFLEWSTGAKRPGPDRSET